MKLLLAVDGSEAALGAVRWVLDHLEDWRTAPELHLLTVQAAVASGLVRRFLSHQAVDDYLREVASDAASGIEEADIRLSGLAVTKRAYSIYQRERYEAVLLVAALRGAHHAAELAGADLVLSISPGIHQALVSADPPREPGIHREIPRGVTERLHRLSEFRKAYEPEGMSPAEFITYGATQRTLSQFCEMGWKQLEGWRGA